MVTKLYLFIFCLLLSVVTVHAAFWDWKAMESNHFRLYYPQQYSEQALTTIEILENSIPLVEKVVPNPFFRKIPIILEDFGQVANGFVIPFPMKVNLMMYKGNFTSYQNYVRLLSVHELVHAMHLSMVSKGPRALSFVFGPLFYPHIYTPRWFTEGLAVVAESDYSAYEGRLNDARQWGYFKQVSRRGELKSLGDITAYFSSEFPYGATPYLYGSQFLNYLRTVYGQEKLNRLLHSFGGSFTSYAMMLFPSMSLDKLAWQVYGKSIERLYQEWQVDEKEQSDDWHIVGKSISDDRGVKPFLLVNDERLYMFHRHVDHPDLFYYKRVSGISKYDSELDSWSLVKRLYRSTDQPFEIRGSSLYITFPQMQSGFTNITMFGYGVIQELVNLDLVTGEETTVFKDKIDAFTVYQDDSNDHIIFAQNRAWMSESILYRWENNVKQKFLSLPISVLELSSTSDLLVGVGQNRQNQWVVFTVDFSTLVVTEVFVSPWSLSHLTVDRSNEGNNVVFTVNKGRSLETYGLNFNTNEVRRLSSGDYADSGVVSGKGLFFTVIGGKGSGVYSQKIVESDSDVQGFDLKRSLNETLFTQESVDENSLRKYSHPIVQSSKRAFLPHSRFGLFNMGEDDLRLIQYYVGYDSLSGVYGQVMLNHFLPAQVFYGFDNNDRVLGVQRPLYHSLSSGVQSLRVGVQYDFYDDDLEVKAFSNYGWLDHKGSIFVMHSFIDSSYSGITQHLYSLKNTSLGVSGRIANNDSFTDRLRGFELISIDNQQVFNGSIDLNRRVVSFSKSRWDFISGIGDVFLSGFFDYSSYRDQVAMGYYTTLEILLFSFNVPLEVSIGQSFSEGEFVPIFVEFGVKLGSDISGLD